MSTATRVKSEAEIEDDLHESIRQEAGRRKRPRTFRGCAAILSVTGDHEMGPTEFAKEAAEVLRLHGYSIEVEDKYAN